MARGQTPSVDWIALETEFINSSVTLQDLAKAHGIKEATVRQRAKRHEWQQKRHALSREVTGKAQEVLTERRVGELAQLNFADVQLAGRIREKAAQLLDNSESAQELRAIASAAEIAQRIGRIALGVGHPPEDDDEPPASHKFTYEVIDGRKGGNADAN